MRSLTCWLLACTACSPLPAPRSIPLSSPAAVQPGPDGFDAVTWYFEHRGGWSGRHGYSVLVSVVPDLAVERGPLLQPSGGLWGPETLELDEGAAQLFQGEPAVAHDGQAFLVAWVTERASAAAALPPGLHLARLGRHGLVGKPITIATEASPYIGASPVERALRGPQGPPFGLGCVRGACFLVTFRPGSGGDAVVATPIREGRLSSPEIELARAVPLTSLAVAAGPAGLSVVWSAAADRRPPSRLDAPPIPTTLYARLIGRDGTLGPGPLQVSAPGQGGPHLIAPGPDGGFLVLWFAADHAFWAARLAREARQEPRALRLSTPLDLSPLTGAQLTRGLGPFGAIAGPSAYLVVWTDRASRVEGCQPLSQSGCNALVGTVVDLSGEDRWPEGEVLFDSDLDQVGSGLLLGHDGVSFVVAWTARYVRRIEHAAPVRARPALSRARHR